MARMAIGVRGISGFRQRAGVAIATLLALAGCGGGGGGGGSPPAPPPPPATFSVGGTVTGLTGTGLVLQNNGGNNLTVNANGNFSFTTRLATGAAYAVTVLTRPSAPSQACIVGDGAGNVASVNVITVDIICGPAPAKFLYVTADSPVNVRGFTINALTGALAPISAPSNPSGSNPGAPVADPDGQFLYIPNASSNNVSVYGINAATGVLTEIIGSPFAAGGTSPQAITFRPDGAFAYVSRFNSGLPGWELATFSVDATTGALSPAAVPAVTFTAGVGTPVIDSDGEFMYVTGGGPPTELYGFSINAGSGALTPVPNSPYANTRPGFMTLNGTGNRLYVSKQSSGFPNDSSILAYNVEATGALTAIVGSAAGTGLSGGPIRLAPDGRFLFIAGTNGVGNSIVSSFLVNQGTGALTAVAPNGTVILGSGSSVNFDVDPSGRALAAFPVQGTAATLIGVDQVSGALNGVLLEPFGYVPLSGVLDRSGLFSYVLEYAGSSTVNPYLIDPVGLRAAELPPISIGGGISLRRAVLVGTQ